MSPLSEMLITCRSTRKVIQKQARRLLGRLGINKSDLDDIRQEITLNLIVEFPKFEPDRSNFEAFTTVVATSTCKDYLRKRKAQKRDPRKCVSLNVPIKTRYEGRREGQDLVGDDAHDRRLFLQSRAPEELAELRLDLASQCERLPEHLLTVVDRLSHETAAEAARAQGLSDSAMRRRITNLGKHFAPGEIEKYLEAAR